MTGYMTFYETIKADQYQHLAQKYDEVNRMLYGMINKSDKFCR